MSRACERGLFRVAASGSLALLLTVGALTVATPACAQNQARVDGIAAVVGGASARSRPVVILRSDVALRARIHLSGNAGRLPLGPLAEPLLAATLEEIIGEVLIAREADRLRAERPDEEAIRGERRRLENTAGGPERLSSLLSALGAEGDEIESIARRRAYVDAFLRANLEGSTVVSDAQVRSVFEDGQHPFVGRTLDEVREVLRVWIAREVLQRDVARWIEVLRARTTVRLLVDWQTREPAAAERSD